MASTDVVDSALAPIAEFLSDGNRQAWDGQMSGITEMQEECLASRRSLAEMTREFQKYNGNEKIKNLGPLLRGYQKEIDRLTKRSKFSEAAFLEVYSTVTQLPDIPTVKNTIKRETSSGQEVAKLQLENENLQRQLEQFKSEIHEIKNQEVTVRRLEDKLHEYETQMDDLVSAAKRDCERELNGKIDEALRTAGEREAELKRQLATETEENERLRKGYDQAQSQLLKIHALHDEQLSGKNAQMEMLVEELHRVTASREEADRKAQQLQSTLDDYEERVQIETEQRVTTAMSSLKRDLDIKTREVAQLNDELHDVERSRQAERESSSLKIQELNLEREKTEALERDLSSRPTPEQVMDMEKKVKTLESLETMYSYNEDDEDVTSSVERLLRDKTRKLESELARLRLSLSEKEENLNSTSETLQTTTAELKRVNQLVERLEDDLSRTHEQTPKSSVSEGEIPDADRASADSDSMLKIVSNQRDRFKALATKLEMEHESQSKELEQAKARITTLERDNVELYEKIRYVQSYAGSTSGAAKRAVARDVESGTSSAIEERYRKLYENSVNPYHLFNKKELKSSRKSTASTRD